MLKKTLAILLAPLLLAGCTATSTNLAARKQLRNPNNLYPVEVAFASRQQSLRWDTIQPYIVVGSDLYPMRVTPLMTNRWEGLVPVPAGTRLIHYRYKFEFKYNAFGSAPKPDSTLSPIYTLQIVDQ